MVDRADLYDVQAKFVYALIVAGKSADFAIKATARLLVELCGDPPTRLPFEAARGLDHKDLKFKIIKARTGNYTKMTRAIEMAASMPGLDLMTCAPDELERVQGVGPKTSRFFIMWIRPEERYAALDVHILAWLRQQGFDAPRSTPGQPGTYRRLERIFIEEADKRGITPRQLDSQIWEEAARRRADARD